MNYEDFVKEQFLKRPVLAKAESLFIEKKGNLTIDEFKNIVLNVYFLSREDLAQKVLEED
jgi:hypothetical protein